MKRSTLIILGVLVGVALLATQSKRIAGMISDTTRKLIQRLEGLRLTAYQDVGGLWTIGYGHLIKPGERFHPYGPVKTITQDEAESLYAADSAAARAAVAQAVHVTLTDQMRAALESLAYNIGSGAFIGSTLVRTLNMGNYASAAEQFAVWNKVNGKVVPGLVSRRAVEKEMFLS